MPPTHRFVPAVVSVLCLAPSLTAAQDAPEHSSVAATPTVTVAPSPGIGVGISPFQQGRVGVSLWAGTTFTGAHTYLKLGAAVGIFLVDGLRLGVGGTVWLFDSPFVASITPDLTYTFHFVKVVKPYVGVFYSHYIVSDNVDDFDSVGARAGVYFVPHSARFYFGGGLVYERLLECHATIVDCNDVYPELTFAFMF